MLAALKKAEAEAQERSTANQITSTNNFRGKQEETSPTNSQCESHGVEKQW